MTLPCIKNHLSQETFQAAPWEFTPNVPAEAKESKEKFGQWARLGTTTHLFFSGVVGLNPAVRVSKENPAHTLVAIIGDYDCPIKDGELDAIKEKLPQDLWPNWVSKTFSGGARLVWLLEPPIAAELEPLRRAFLNHAGKTLKAHKLLPGIDSDAWKDCSKTYECGSEWRQFKETPLSSSIVQQWLFEASSRLKPGDLEGEGPEIPLDIVAKEVERQFPGRWAGPFEVGARGVVFWDPSSVNPTASIVCTTGMVAFGQERSFYSWKDCLGAAFVHQFVENKLGAAVEGIYYDSRTYWSKDARGIWVSSSKEVIELELKHAGLDGTKDKKESMSEVDAALRHIHHVRRVDKVVPIVYNPQSLIESGGKRTLNTSRVKVIEPRQEPAQWRVDFPFLGEYFDTCFDDTCSGETGNNGQLAYFLGWLKVFYESARIGRLKKGHALFLGGPVGIGKTFLSNVIVSLIMGGHFPAARYLKGETNFNRGLFECGLLTVDDSTPGQSEEMARKFAERVKQFVVNSRFEFHAKFRDEVEFDWTGRVVVTLNNDPVSLRMMPSFEGSIEDKLMVLLMKRPDVTFSQDYAQNEARVLKELPAFLRWLCDWHMPEGVISSARLGVNGFIHDTLREGGMASNGATEIMQLLDLHLKATKEKEIVGKSSEILIALIDNPALEVLARKENARTFARKLSLLSTMRGTRVSRASKTSVDGGMIVWRVTAPEPES